MKVIRHTDVLSATDLDSIKGLFDGRQWTMQSSTEGDGSRFFMSGLLQKEIDFFNPRFGPLVNRYIADNAIAKPVKFERAYINCHPCFHPGSWHIDNYEGFTLIYYPPSAIDFGEEGGTDIQGHGYQPYIANSLILLPADALHMAREHTTKGVFRYSVAFKFQM
jgi:hypothetical protein